MMQAIIITSDQAVSDIQMRMMYLNSTTLKMGYLP